MASRLSKSQHYNGNPKIKRANVKIPVTQFHIDEWAKCRDDIVYFVRKYMKIKHVDKGKIAFDLWDFQEELLKQFVKERFNIVNTARQVGKTTITVAFLLHYVIFNDYKTIGILANKGETSRKILARLKLAYENLPGWLQRGVVEWNKGSIELENGSIIMATSTSTSASRGDSFSTVFVDEAAFIPTNIWDEFYKSVYPTISSGKETKIILVSTPNGLNHFYKLFTFAQQGKNDYTPFTVTWKSVPGRDEEWKRQTIANTSIDDFLQEQECQFLGSSNTLISLAAIKNMAQKNPIETALEEDFKMYEKPKEGHVYVATIDVARGRGLDYSALSVLDITSYPFRQIATYRSNKISPLLFPNIIHNICKKYNRAFALIENNDVGHEVADILNYDLEYENIINTNGGRKFQLGVHTTPKVKRLGCSNFKDLVETQKLVIQDYDTIDEIAGFVKKGNKYEADGDGHDDMVMGLVLFSWLTSQDYFKSLTNKNIRQEMFEENMRIIEQNITPFGVIADGVTDPEDPDEFVKDGLRWKKVSQNRSYFDSDDDNPTDLSKFF